MKKPPHAVVASLLAVTTVLMAQLPWHLPVWAIFISWAGTFAMGGPSPANMKRIWATLPIGSITGFLVVVGFGIASKNLSGNSLLFAECVILFCLNSAMILAARFPVISFVPGMFFGFASYFATMYGGFGPTPKDPLSALGVVLVMSFLGPIYAWITANFSHRHVPLENTFPKKTSEHGHMQNKV